MTLNPSTPRSCKVRTSFWTDDLQSSTISPVVPATPSKAFSRKLTFNSTEDELLNQKKRYKTSKIPVGGSFRSKSCERDHSVRAQRASTGSVTQNQVVVTPSHTPKTPLSILNNPTSATACRVRDIRQKRVLRSKSSGNLAQCFVSLTPLSSKVPADRLITEKKPKKNLRQKFRKSVMKPDMDGNGLNGHSFVDWFRKRHNDS